MRKNVHAVCHEKKKKKQTVQITQKIGLLSCSVLLCATEKRFQKLMARVPSGLPNTRKKAVGLVLRLRAFICFRVSGNPGETLALVFEILNP